MRKIFSLMLAMLLLLALSACGEQPAPTTQTTQPAQSATPTTPTAEGTQPQQTESTPAEAYFCYTLAGVELIPGAVFKPEALPEAESVYQVPSCAIEGTDNVYNYGALEVTAFDDGKNELIYSIYLLDANTPTPEGLYLGDALSKVDTIYGTERTENGTELVYQKGDTVLSIILDNEFVISIEYRAANI